MPSSAIPLIAALFALMPSAVYAADGRYQLVQSCVIDTQTGAVWCLGPAADTADNVEMVLVPTLYRGPDGKTLTATPPPVGATANDPLGIRDKRP
jgi:hypothetical protein